MPKHFHIFSPAPITGKYPEASNFGGIHLFPEELKTKAYEYLLRNKEQWIEKFNYHGVFESQTFVKIDEEAAKAFKYSRLAKKYGL